MRLSKARGVSLAEVADFEFEAGSAGRKAESRTASLTRELRRRVSLGLSTKSVEAELSGIFSRLYRLRMKG